MKNKILFVMVIIPTIQLTWPFSPSENVEHLIPKEAVPGSWEYERFCNTKNGILQDSHSLSYCI